MHVTTRAQHGAIQTRKLSHAPPSSTSDLTVAIEGMAVKNPSQYYDTDDASPDQTLERTLCDPSNNIIQQRLPKITACTTTATSTVSSLSSKSLEPAAVVDPEWIRTRLTRLRPFSGSGQSLFEISFTFVRRDRMGKCMLKRVDVSKNAVAAKPSNIPDTLIDNKENGPSYVARPKPSVIGEGRFSRHIFNNAMRTLARTDQFTFVDSVDVTAAHPDVQMAEVTLASNDSDAWPSNALFMLIADNITKDEEANSSLLALSNHEGYHPVIRCEDMTSNAYESRAMRATIFFVHRAILRPMATRDAV